ncbi:hypothetical protein [Planotetraspora kaengkrachanensis]|uniref:Uncharacterized protein n=1 Tax=Planotetraspora kaengkrachanensis TaxID=575193 RepID=A0A8J3Q052_9ACTN|nr:hypothetical protein [Planotetraspora kaengkrachanensis]GIG84439.1 hypothetical protein Pka01_75660 [Planotetraspora kaengkrachanensis]
MIALIRFRLAGYARSHRAIQPLIGLLPLLAILYATPIPAGEELGAMADSAGILLPVFAWAARGLLDSEPDEQRMISIAAHRRGELLSGLIAACVFDLGLTVIAELALLARLSADPGIGAIMVGVCLHLFSVLAGVALGALTSRPVLPSPAVSSLALILGYLAILLISASGARWLTVPVMSWMKDGHHDVLLGNLPLLAVQSLIWPLVGLAAYAWLRRTRP